MNLSNIFHIFIFSQKFLLFFIAKFLEKHLKFDTMLFNLSTFYISKISHKFMLYFFFFVKNKKNISYIWNLNILYKLVAKSGTSLFSISHNSRLCSINLQKNREIISYLKIRNLLISNQSWFQVVLHIFVKKWGMYLISATYLSLIYNQPWINFVLHIVVTI